MFRGDGTRTRLSGYGMKICVIMSTYNGEKYLAEQLDSILHQEGVDVTLFVRDDGSSDGTPDLLRETASADDRFVFGTEQGKHLGAAGNFISLVRQADTDYCLFCDQDDIWEPEKISVLIQAMLEQEALYGNDTPLLVH